MTRVKKQAKVLLDDDEWTEGGSIRSRDEAVWQREMLEHRIEAFLRSKGWRHTSDTPGSYWLWEREVDGRTLLLDTAHALGMQDRFDQDEKASGA